MKKYEYKIETPFINRKQTPGPAEWSLEKLMNNYGRDGWEIFQVEKTGSEERPFVFYMRREV